MQLEDQVVGLGLSQQLKELGFEQGNSLFYWVQVDLSPNNDYAKPDLQWVVLDAQELENYRIDIPHCSAYTVAEFGEIDDRIISFKHPNGNWVACMMSNDFGVLDFKYLPSTNIEADARAKMLIYLKENNL